VVPDAINLDRVTFGYNGFRVFSDRDIVSYWIAELGLDELAHRRLGDLQPQRVLLAQAFAQQAPVCAAG
jgi:ABC-type cobalamin/Fe3+-siderophores transport system ATPase subunit